MADVTQRDIQKLQDSIHDLRDRFGLMLSRSGGYVSGQIDLAGWLQLDERSAPSQPASGNGRVYAKTDGHVYWQDDSGTEYDLTSGGGGAGAPSNAQYLTLALDATLTGERRFVPGTGLSAVDDGADGDYTLSVDATELSHDDLLDVSVNDHHNKQHTLTSTADHSAVGMTAGETIRASSPVAWGWDKLHHWDLDQITANDHHNRQHGIVTAADHTVSGSALDLVGLDGVDSLAVLTPSADVSGGETVVLRSQAGKLTLADVATTQVSSHLIPSLTDTYDLGSSTKLWRKGWLSEMDAVLFAENTITLLGGWFYVTKYAGTAEEDIDDSETQIDLGVSDSVMAEDDFIVFRQVGQVEYMQLGSYVGTNVWNVTRDVDGSGANTWPQGAPYACFGYDGDGRIELNAYNTPRISVLRQGTSYNAQTELIRFGDLDGLADYSSETYGAFIGDYAGDSWMAYDPTNGLRVHGNALIDGTVVADKLQVGLATGNLCPGTDFSDDPVGDTSVPDGWTVSHTGTGTIYYRGIYEDDGTYTGIKGKRVLYGRITDDPSSDTFVGFFSDYIPVNTDLSYVLSGWFRGFGAADHIYFGVRCYDSSLVQTSSAWKYCVMSNGTIAGTATRYWGTISGEAAGNHSFDTDTAYVKVLMWIPYTPGGNSGAFVWDISFSQGDYPPAQWSPAQVGYVSIDSNRVTVRDSGGAQVLLGKDGSDFGFFGLNASGNREAYLDASDGKFYCSGGLIRADKDGFWIEAASGSAPVAGRAINLVRGSTTYAMFGDYYVESSPNFYHIAEVRAKSVASKDTYASLVAELTSGYTAHASLGVPGMTFELYQSASDRYAVSDNGRLKVDNGATGLGYSQAPIELIQTWGGSPPRLAFHYAGMVASQIGFASGDSSGTVCILNNPGSGYEDLKMNDLYVEGSIRNSTCIGARKSRSSNQSIANNTVTTVALNRTDFDTGDTNVNADSTRLVAQRAGVYLVSGGVYWAANTNGRRHVSLRLNGSYDIASQESGIGSGGYCIQTCSTVWNMSSGNYVQLIAFQSSGGGLNATGGATEYRTFLSLVRIA